MLHIMIIILLPHYEAMSNHTPLMIFNIELLPNTVSESIHLVVIDVLFFMLDFLVANSVLISRQPNKIIA